MNKTAILFFSIIALVVVGAMSLYLWDKHVPMDASNHGNTPGNLQNGGYFFEMDGKVFFANASDNYCLYSMNPDESKPKRLTNMGTKYISGADGFLYFYMDSTKKSSNVTGLGSATNQYGIYRCRTSGRDQNCLVRDFCGEVQLCGEYLYYQIKTSGTLNKIKCNHTGQEKVSDELISPLCYDNGVIYYSGVTADHNIHALYTNSGDMSTDFINGFYFYPAVQGGYIYYLNGESNYSIWRTNLATGEQSLVTSDRVDCFTLNGTHIYYSFSNADAPSLRRCDLDGGNKTILYEGVVNSINVTSQYVYFRLFGDDSLWYHMPIDASLPAQPFIVSSK